MGQRRFGAWFACIACISLALSGCESSKQPPEIGAAEGSAGPFQLSERSTVWPFWPTTMRIHPLTRIVNADEGIILEARIEFSDAHGSTTRSVGQLRLLITDTAANQETILVEEWNNDLRDIDTNVLHFDDITRTYLFRLRLDPAQLTATTELHAQFLAADNPRLTASHRLR